MSAQRQGLCMSGVVIIPRSMPVGQALDDLALWLDASLPEEIDGRILYLPL